MRNSKEKRLTFKQEDFCRNIVAGESQVQAAINANYSIKSADSASAKLMQNPIIIKRIAELKKELSIASSITPEKVLGEMAAIAFSNIADVLDFENDLKLKKNIPKTVSVAIKSVVVTETMNEGKNGEMNSRKQISVQMHDKIAAAKSLGQYFGLYNDLNSALATLKQYGSLVATEDGHVFRSSNLLDTVTVEV